LGILLLVKWKYQEVLLATAGFTTVQETQRGDAETLCFICDAIETCKMAANEQVGQANCQDFEDCSTWGSYCNTDPVKK
jgi:hypothetical protein